MILLGEFISSAPDAVSPVVLRWAPGCPAVLPRTGEWQSIRQMVTFLYNLLHDGVNFAQWAGLSPLLRIAESL